MKEICIKRTMERMGKDLVIHIQNENGHIGSVVTGQPYVRDHQIHVTLNTWNQLGHKDDIVAAMYVKAAVLKYECVVTCVCGIHLDDITPEEMKEILDWVKDDIRNL